MSDGIREFVYAMQEQRNFTVNIEEYALWLLDQHTVETGTISDHAGEDDVTYCGSCGQLLDGADFCDHIARLAALWSWHPDYRDEDWGPMEGDDEQP